MAGACQQPPARRAPGTGVRAAGHRSQGARQPWSWETGIRACTERVTLCKGCPKTSFLPFAVGCTDITKDLSLMVQLLSLQKHSAVAFYLSWMALGPLTALLQSRVLFKSVCSVTMEGEEEFLLKVFEWFGGRNPWVAEESSILHFLLVSWSRYLKASQHLHTWVPLTLLHQGCLGKGTLHKRAVWHVQVIKKRANSVCFCQM